MRRSKLFDGSGTLAPLSLVHRSSSEAGANDGLTGNLRFVLTTHAKLLMVVALATRESVNVPRLLGLAPKRKRLPRDTATCNRVARDYDGLEAVHEHQTIQEGTTRVTDEPTPDTTTDKPAQPSDATSVERNKAVSRRWIEVFSDRDDAAGPTCVRRDYVAYAPVSLEPTPLDSEAWTRFLSGFVEAFLTFSSGLRTRWAKATSSRNGSTSKAPTRASSKGFRLPTGKSRFPASSSTGSSTAELRSTGSRWTPSRFFSSWVW
jgi:hypothetical protein